MGDYDADLRGYVEAELQSLRNRVKQLAVNVDAMDRTVKAKDAHLVSNAYHMSSVESNTQNGLNEVNTIDYNLVFEYFNILHRGTQII